MISVFSNISMIVSVGIGLALTLTSAVKLYKGIKRYKNVQGSGEADKARMSCRAYSMALAIGCTLTIFSVVVGVVTS